MNFNLLEFETNPDHQWWVGILGVEYKDFDGHLLYIEQHYGTYKFDILWLRSFYYKYFVNRD